MCWENHLRSRNRMLNFGALHGTNRHLFASSRDLSSLWSCCITRHELTSIDCYWWKWKPYVQTFVSVSLWNGYRSPSDQRHAEWISGSIHRCLSWSAVSGQWILFERQFTSNLIIHVRWMSPCVSSDRIFWRIHRSNWMICSSTRLFMILSR